MGNCQIGSELLQIKAHFAICFLALALVRTVEYLLSQSGHHIPVDALHQGLRQVKTMEIESNGQLFNFTENLPPEILSVYHLLNIPTAPIFAQSFSS